MEAQIYTYICGSTPSTNIDYAFESIKKKWSFEEKYYPEKQKQMTMYIGYIDQL